MSLIFYDHLIEMPKIVLAFNDLELSEEDKHEVWSVVDEIVHNRIISCIFDNLDYEYHDEFINKIFNDPHDRLLLGFLKERVKLNVENLIINESRILQQEMLENLFSE